MGYYVRPIKKTGRPWAVLYRETVGAERKARTLRDEELGNHHFSPRMTIEEARDRASKLNEQAETKRYARKKLAAADRVRRDNIDLALAVVDEEEFIEWCREEHRITFEGPNKLNSHWQCTKRILKDLAVKPTELHEYRRRLYGWFSSHAFSVAYLTKVLRFVNLYGRFYARRYKTFFEEVPFPRGQDKEEINDAFFDAGKQSKAALPLTPEALESARGSLTDEHYNWLYLSLWLGLRPLEVDALKEPKRFKISREGDTVILHVYQSKLKSISRDKRWKLIPLVEPEQKAIPVILKKEFKRPLVKMITDRFGIGHNTYSGRKGFEALMRDRGHPFDYVSSWLGHQSLDRTWKSYTDRTRPRFNRTD